MKRNIIAFVLGSLFSNCFFLFMCWILIELNVIPMEEMCTLLQTTSENAKDGTLYFQLLEGSVQFLQYYLIPLTILLTGILVGVVSKSRSYLISIISVSPLVLIFGFIVPFFMGYVVWLSFYLGLAGISAYGIDFLIKKRRSREIGLSK